MALDTDGLLHQLLFKCALAGDKGLDIQGLSDAVTSFYSRIPVEKEEVEDDGGDENGDILFSVKPPGPGPNQQAPASDPQHLDKLWTWLVEHPDIEVRSIEQDVAPATQDNDRLASVFFAHAGDRLYANENIIWHALTDHGVDHKRIPKLEFQVLSVIAAAGPGGVLQPDVTKLTQQDKRSVPKRTDALAQKGLITKEPCVGHGIKTSLLKLKKFTLQGESSSLFEVGENRGKWAPDNGVQHMIQFDEWFAEIIAHLKKHNNIMAYDDLRKEMGVFGKKWETRALHRCMRRLYKTGLMKRVKARDLSRSDGLVSLQGNPDAVPQADVESTDTAAPNEVSAPKDETSSRPAKARWVRCIRLVREPGAKDKAAFVSNAAAQRSLEEDRDNSEPEADEEEVEDLDAGEALNVLADIGQSRQTPKTKQRLPPQWSPGVHHTQFLFNLVQSFGIEGASTMDLTDCAMGHLWRRPLDELLGRMTDVWMTSQPPHLRHLSIVRDIGFSNKTSHHQYRTFNSFKHLVDLGAVTWEAIGQNSKEIEMESIDSDEWGFPTVSPSTMVGSNGIANVATCKMSVDTPNHRRDYDPTRARRVLTSRQSPSALRTSQPAGRNNATPSARIHESPVEQPTPIRKRLTGNRRKISQRPSDNTPSAMSPDPSARETTGRQLFKMTSQRLDAERRAWETRVRRLATSLALAEVSFNPANVGTESDTEAQPPQKRRKITTGDDHKPSADDSTDADPVLGSRVTAIETELLRRSEPRIYINPPGSGQAKMTLTKPVGRPKKYLIAVCKSSKLLSLNWFTTDQNTPQNARQPASTGDATSGSFDVNESQDRISPMTEDRVSTNSVPDNNSKADFRFKGGKRKSTVSLQGHLVKKQAVTREYNTTTFTPINGVTSGSSTLASEPGDNLSATHSLGGASSAVQSNDPEGQSPASPGTENAQSSEPRETPSTQVDGVVSRGERGERASSVERFTRITSNDRGEPVDNSLGDRHAATAATSPSPSQRTSRTDHEMSSVNTISVGNAAGQHVPKTDDGPTPTRKTLSRVKHNLPKSGGIVKHQRETILLNIVHKYGGILPGDKELYYPFITEWEKTYSVRPDRSTFDRILKDLVSVGKLQRFPFTFPGRCTDAITKHVVTEPEIDPESEAVKQVKDSIIAAYPSTYLPPEVELAPFLRARLQSELQPASTRPKQLTIKDAFVEDESEGVRRLHPLPPRPIPVKLGMTQESLEINMATRKRRREQEQKRKERYMRAQMEDEIEEASSALQIDFQLEGYEHDPDRARINRGPYGRSHLSKLMGWSAFGQNSQRGALGLLGAAHKTREERESPGQRAMRFQKSSLPSSVDAGQVGNGSGFVEVYTLMTPYQRFHEHSGTFGTDPVVVTLAGKPAWLDSFGRNGIARVQLSMQLADVYRSADAAMLPARENPRTSNASRRSRKPTKKKQPVARLTSTLKTSTLKTSTSKTSTSKILSRKEVALRASRSGIFSMSKEEEKRLVIAVIISRTLVGGLEQTPNWGIVHQIFHYKFDANYCRNRWSSIRSKYARIADMLQEKFQDLFLQAYENGELPAIDYLEPEKYDWNTLVEWTEARLNPQEIDVTDKTLPNLPNSRTALDHTYELKVAENVYGISKGEYWASNVTLIRRDELARDWTHTIADQNSSIDRGVVRDEDPLMLAKSWVRANVLTPEGEFDSTAAGDKLSQLKDKTLPDALDALLGAKIIRMENKGRTIPGRNYDISDTVLAAFKRSWDATHLRQAAVYKTQVLDAAFVESGSIEPPYSMPDHETLCITNLIARGYVKVVPNLPPVNNDLGAPWPRLSKWGFTDGNYKTVQLDRTRLHFGFSIVPTERYVYGNPTNAGDIAPPLELQVPGELGARLPLWTDINGKCIPSVWDMTVMATLHLIVFRPGMSVKTLANAYKGKFWAWEIAMFLKWAEEAGILQKVGWTEGDDDDAAEVGWTTTDWWWLALDGVKGNDDADVGRDENSGVEAGIVAQSAAEVAVNLDAEHTTDGGASATADEVADSM